MALLILFEVYLDKCCVALHKVDIVTIKNLDVNDVQTLKQNYILTA